MPKRINLSVWRPGQSPDNKLQIANRLPKKSHVIKRVTAVESEFVVLYPDRDHADIRRVQVWRGEGKGGKDEKGEGTLVIQLFA